MAKIRVPKQVLLDGAQMSMAAMLAEVLGFLKERKIPVRDLIAYIGEKFEGLGRTGGPRRRRGDGALLDS